MNRGTEICRVFVKFLSSAVYALEILTIILEVNIRGAVAGR